MGQLGLPELLIIGAVALVLFGPARLPELGRSLGRAMREFRSAVRSLEEDVEERGGAARQAGRAGEAEGAAGGRGEVPPGAHQEVTRRQQPAG